MTLSKIKTLVLALSVTLLAIGLITFPQDALQASIRGLNMWWEVVFPSLLPFFIVSEMLIGFGVVRFIGVLLEPLMRPLFKVPGVGGFVWAMGMASGYPAGAKLTARLRQEEQLTTLEAERLVSFTNSSNPLFIFGAIAVGFFGNPKLGVILAVSHYLGNFFVGLIMRFHGNEQVQKVDEERKKLSIVDAFRALHRTRLQEKRPLGKLLGDAVISSIQTLLMIGGFIILFSVFNTLLSLVHVTELIGFVFTYILHFFQLSSELSIPLISGLFEITLGSKLTSQTPDTQLLHQLIITSFILAFSGFSVQAQVASILAETDIRFKPFFTARIIHGFFAAFFSLILWNPLYLNLQETAGKTGQVIQVFLPIDHSPWLGLWHAVTELGPIITICSLILYTILYTKRLYNPRNY
ncbi:sporulation integral membrane protein YlbJ [Bacillus timonensis]|nr:sporulation integral membrane protein YlbJ [Bacillus timonensis]